MCNVWGKSQKDQHLFFYSWLNIFDPIFHNSISTKNIVFALKRIGKLYPQKQHWVIVRNNHIAEQGSSLLMMDLSKKRSRRRRQIKWKNN